MIIFFKKSSVNTTKEGIFGAKVKGFLQFAQNVPTLLICDFKYDFSIQNCSPETFEDIFGLKIKDFNFCAKL